MEAVFSPVVTGALDRRRELADARRLLPVLRNRLHMVPTLSQLTYRNRVRNGQYVPERRLMSSQDSGSMSGRGINFRPNHIVDGRRR